MLAQSQQRNNLYPSDTPTVPKDREAKPEEKFSSSKYPGLKAGKLTDKLFFPINVMDDILSDLVRGTIPYTLVPWAACDVTVFLQFSTIKFILLMSLLHSYPQCSVLFPVSSQIMSRHLEFLNVHSSIMEKVRAREFLQHCEENNLEKVTDCFSRGVDVNTVSEDGHWSGLTIAAHY